METGAEADSLDGLSTEEIDDLGATGCFVRDGFLQEAEVLALRAQADTLHSSGAFAQAGIRRGAARALDSVTRSDQTAWVDASARGALAHLRSRFASLGQALSRGAYLGLGDFDLQLARYDAGSSYARHRDAFPGSDNRRVSAIVYLNPAWTPAHGGLLQLHLGSGTRAVEPLPGRLIVFISERVEHEVSTVHAPRYAATAWYSGRR